MDLEDTSPVAPVDGESEVINIDGQDLTEIDVGDEMPIDDDESVAGTDIDNVEELDMEEDEESPEGGYGMDTDEMREEAVDMSVACFSGHSDCVYSVAVHPLQPGVVLTGGGDDKAFLWRYAPGAPEDEDYGMAVQQGLELGGHTDTVTSVGFNFDGSLALTGAYDGKVQIWNTVTGAMVQCLEGPDDIEWAVWHPRGNAVLAGSADGTAWMWLSHNGQCVQVFAGHDGAVTSGLFTTDGKFVVTGGEDGTVRVWAPKTGQCKHVFEGHTGHTDSVTSIACSPDGDRILSGGMDGKVMLLQISGKRMLKEFIPAAPIAKSTEGDEKKPAAGATEEGDVDGGAEDDVTPVQTVECVGFCQNTAFNWAASGGSSKLLLIWDVISGQCRTSCKHGGSVVSLKWHSALPYITTAALDNFVRVWDARSGACVLELTGHNDLVTNLDMRTITIADDRASASAPSTETPPPPPNAQVSGEKTIDVIVAVSDDHTARVFHFSANELQAASALASAQS